MAGRASSRQACSKLSRISSATVGWLVKTATLANQQLRAAAVLAHLPDQSLLDSYA